MKKKILGSLAVLVIAAVAVFNIELGSKANSLSNVVLANVEALADEAGIASGAKAKCTGPKSEATGYCNCTNTNSCADLYGCN